MKKIRITESNLEDIVKKIISESNIIYSDVVKHVETLYDSGVVDYKQLINKTSNHFSDLEKDWIYDAVNSVVDKKKRYHMQEDKDDRCVRIAKRKYDVWPSAYASGAVVRCRKGEIWKDEK